MGNHLCVTVKAKRKATTKSTPSSTLNLETILENYVPPNHKFCCESRPIFDSFSPEGCCHFYCTKCTLRYIVSKLQNNVLNLNCPESGCRDNLSPHFCKPCNSTELRVHVVGEGAVRVRDSREGQVLLSLQRLLGAVVVQAPWHAEISCDKFQMLKNTCDDLIIDHAKRRKWRRCPNCKHYVEKKQGCDAMTCWLSTYSCLASKFRLSTQSRSARNPGLARGSPKTRLA
ncbi:hypothetical protein glysoja_033297 [Glycine soja]|uniref:Uncharacterized protein n=2 Tax=Glycine soja TaxID=3848 RepID=A0A0B2SXT8_GLYSO|nr:hypothetical protein glysoja_033297 [Glycine soja]